jgi:hypothetical protein
LKKIAEATPPFSPDYRRRNDREQLYTASRAVERACRRSQISRGPFACLRTPVGGRKTQKSEVEGGKQAEK